LPKFLFKSTQNRWFAQFCAILSIIGLGTVLFQTHIHTFHLGFPSKENKFYEYLFYGMGIGILALTICAWFLRKQLTVKPFYLSLFLFLLAIIEWMIFQYPTFSHPVFFWIFLPKLLDSMIFSVLWWLSQITTPKKFSLTDFTNTKYQTAGWIALFLMALLVTITIWLQAHNNGSVCINDFFCTLPFFSKNNLIALLHFLINQGMMTANTITIWVMSYYLIGLISYIYLGLLGFWLIFSMNLQKIGILFVCFFIFKIILDQIDLTSLNPHIIAYIDFTVLLLLLMIVISFISQLYQKLQLRW